MNTCRPEPSYVKQGGGLTEVLVRASGHLVPRDVPAQAYQLMSSFISQNFTTFWSYTDKLKYTPMTDEKDTSGLKMEGANGMLAVSILINVILLFTLIVLLAFYIKWRRQRDHSEHNRVYYSPLLTSDI